MKQPAPLVWPLRRHKILALRTYLQRRLLRPKDRSEPSGPPDGRSRRLRRADRGAVLVLSLALVATAAACYAEPAPQGWATPAIQGTTVYYSPTAGKLEAYDTATKKVVWDFPSAQSKNVKPQAIYSRPVLNGQTLYFGAYDGNIYALSQSSGQVQWQFNTGSAVIGSVLVQDGVVYAGNSDGQVYALKAGDGSKLWQDQAGKRVWSSPVAANGLIVVTSMDSHVYAFNPQGGLAWRSDVASAAIADTPDVTQNQIAFGAFDKRFHAISPTSGDALWQTDPAGSWFWTQGLLSGDNLYAGNLDGHIYAYNAGNGSLEWQVALGAPVRANPVLSAGTLVVATRDGSIYGLDPANGSQKWGPVSAGAQVLANLVPSQDNAVYAVTQPGTKNAAHLLEINPSTGSSTSLIAP